MNDDGRDIVLLLTWLLAIILISTTLLFFTKEARTAALVETINGLVAESGATYRLDTELDVWGKNGRASLAGQRFSLKNTEGFAVIQTVLQEGSPLVRLALFTADGLLTEVIPLGTASKRVYERMDVSVNAFYNKRLEKSQLFFIEREPR